MGINFYWRTVGMNRLSGRTQLTDCIEEKLRNFLGSSMQSSYPDTEGLFNDAYESAERQCRMELELGPHNPRRGHQTRSRLNRGEREEMRRYMDELRAAEYDGYPLGFQDRNATIGANLRAPVRAPGERGPGYNGQIPRFTGFGGGRRRTRRRRTTKKQRRKQTRRV